METRCPECAGSIRLDAPGTDPAAAVECGACGERVKPGAFRCPDCGAELQVDRALLPRGGARGRCPACSHVLFIPSLGPERADTVRLAAASLPAAPPEPSIDPGATLRFQVSDLAGEVPVPEEAVEEVATVRFSVASVGSLGAAPESEGSRREVPVAPASPATGTDEDVIEIVEEEESPVPISAWMPEAEEPAPSPAPVPLAPAMPAPASSPGEPDPGATIRLAPRPAVPVPPIREASGTGGIPLARPPRTPSAVRSRPPAPVPPPVRRSSLQPVLLGLLLGGLIAGGAGYGLIAARLFTPPPSPLAGILPLRDAASAWGCLLGGAGALVGALLGSLLRPRR